MASASIAVKNVAVMLEIFHAIETRDEGRVLDLVDPEVEISWPPPLPYGGVSRGLDRKHPTWSETWDPLQPTDAEKKMDPRVIAASDREVTVLWHQRGVSPSGDRFDAEVLALYELHNGKLTRAQMFYFDTAAVVSFLRPK